MTPSGRDDRLLLRLARCEAGPASVRFRELRQLCEEVFGARRQGRGSHLLFRTGLREHPIVNLQPRGSMAKPYQVQQAVRAIRLKLSQED